MGGRKEREERRRQGWQEWTSLSFFLKSIDFILCINFVSFNVLLLLLYIGRVDWNQM